MLSGTAVNYAIRKYFPVPLKGRSTFRCLRIRRADIAVPVTARWRSRSTIAKGVTLRHRSGFHDEDAFAPRAAPRAAFSLLFAAFRGAENQLWKPGRVTRWAT